MPKKPSFISHSFGIYNHFVVLQFTLYKNQVYKFIEVGYFLKHVKVCTVFLHFPNYHFWFKCALFPFMSVCSFLSSKRWNSFLLSFTCLSFFRLVFRNLCWHSLDISVWNERITSIITVIFIFLFCDFLLHDYSVSEPFIKFIPY